MHSAFEKQGFHLLIDPDKWLTDALSGLISDLPQGVQSLVVGGSYIHSGRMAQTVELLGTSSLPVGAFAGAGPIDGLIDARMDFALVPIVLGARSTAYVTDHLLGLVDVARRLDVSLYCMGYLILDGGQKSTTCSFMTQHQPAPRRRPDLVELFAGIASTMGLQGLYLEAGSGAEVPITAEEVAAARSVFPRTLMVGGGLRDVETCEGLFAAGADALFIGTHLEQTGTLGFLTH